MGSLLARRNSGASPLLPGLRSVSVGTAAGTASTALATLAVRLARSVRGGPVAAVSRASETSRAAPFHAFRGLFASLFPNGVIDIFSGTPLGLADNRRLSQVLGLGPPAGPDTGGTPPMSPAAPLSPSAVLPFSGGSPPSLLNTPRNDAHGAPRGGWVGEAGGPSQSVAGGPALQGFLVRILLRRAKAGALLLVIEDMHQGDSQSWSALTSLAAALPSSLSEGVRLGLLVTARGADDDVAAPGSIRGAMDQLSTGSSSMRGTLLLASASSAERLAGLPRARRIALAPLAEPDTGALIRAAIGAGGVVPSALRAFVHQQSGGVPGIAVDLTRRA
eukprot:tig00020675_g12698.t1